MQRLRTAIVPLALSLTLGFAAALPARAELKSFEKRFLKKAAEQGRASVAYSRLTGDRASNDAVKNFGGMMFNDYQQVNERLAKLSAAKGLDLGNDPGKEQKRAAKMASLSGSDFDKEYMKQMVKDQEQFLLWAEAAADRAVDPDVKSFATDTLAALRLHLDKAYDTMSLAGLKVSSKGFAARQREAEAGITGPSARFLYFVARSVLEDEHLTSLASSHAESGAVKDLNSRISGNYPAVDAQLKILARDLGMFLPAGLDDSRQAAVEKLSRLSGREFDRAWVEETVRELRKEVYAFTQVAERAPEPAIKAFAARHLPVYKENLRVAEQVFSGLQ